MFSNATLQGFEAYDSLPEDFFPELSAAFAAEHDPEIHRNYLQFTIKSGREAFPLIYQAALPMIELLPDDANRDHLSVTAESNIVLPGEAGRPRATIWHYDAANMLIASDVLPTEVLTGTLSDLALLTRAGRKVQKTVSDPSSLRRRLARVSDEQLKAIGLQIDTTPTDKAACLVGGVTLHRGQINNTGTPLLRTCIDIQFPSKRV